MGSELCRAPQVAEIADKLIVEHHERLAGVKIEYVFRRKHTKSHGRVVYGKCRKVGALAAFLAADPPPGEFVDCSDVALFVVEIAYDMWEMMTESERVALVDHELCHAAVTYDAEGDARLAIRGHDVEEFAEIIERRGLWTRELAEFGGSVQQRFGFDDEQERT